MGSSPTAWLGSGDDLASRRSALPCKHSQSRLKPAHGLGGQALARASAIDWVYFTSLSVWLCCDSSTRSPLATLYSAAATNAFPQAYARYRNGLCYLFGTVLPIVNISQPCIVFKVVRNTTRQPLLGVRRDYCLRHAYTIVHPMPSACLLARCKATFPETYMAVANRAAKIFLLAGCLCSSLISIL
jgi:hypothetical protein